MKNAIYALLVLCVFSLPAFGQENIEFYGGYQHASGDQGLDGFNLGLGWNPVPAFQLFLNYDGLYDHSTLGAFEFTSVGSTFVNSHMLGLLTGPRYFLHGADIKGHTLLPFVEAGFGEYRLRTELSSAITGNVASADTAFAWALGGGADYKIYRHWSARADLGFLRTHFANGGQSRIRLGFGVRWTARTTRN